MSSEGFQRAKEEYLREQSRGNRNPLLIFIVAIIFFAIGLYMNNNTQEFFKTAKPISGIASYDKMSVSTDENGYKTCNVYVKY